MGSLLDKCVIVCIGYHNHYNSRLAVHYPGTSAILTTHQELCQPIDIGNEDEDGKTSCNKETGEKQRLRKWTRGVWMCVGGGGLIQTWQPLYK